MVTVSQRIQNFKSQTNYLGMDINANKVKDAIVVQLTVYMKTYGINATKRMEEWIVPNATEDDYLIQPAYKIAYNVGKAVQQMTMFGRIRRWFR